MMISQVPTARELKITSKLPQGFFTNDYDRQALELMLVPAGNVELYKGSHFMPPAYRGTLQSHTIGLAENFLSLPFVQNTLADNKDKNTVQTIYDTGSCIMRHDIHEFIREAQTFQQKSNPYLPKIPIKAIESAIALHGYNYALKCVYAKDHGKFLDTTAQLQREFADFDTVATALAAAPDKTIYSRYIMDGLTRIRDVLMEGSKSIKLKGGQKQSYHATAQAHFIAYQTCEKPSIRYNSVPGLLTKLLDKNVPEYCKRGQDRAQDPSVGGLLLDREPNHLFLATIHRSEEFLLPLVNVIKSHDRLDLYPLINDCYRYTYERIHDYALLSKPVIFFDGAPTLFESSEPLPQADDRDFVSYFETLEQELTQRRQTVHPLADTSIQSNKELAARALTIRDLQSNRSLLYTGKFTKPFKERFEYHLNNIKPVV
jgi:hypothetical protein